MKTSQWIIGAAAMGAFLTGCQSAPKVNLSQPLALPQALSQTVNLGQSARKQQNFSRPLIATPRVGTRVAKQAGIPLGLIQATNPQQRTTAVARGRRDPFSMISLAPIAVATTTNAGNLSAASQIPPAPGPAAPTALSIPLPPPTLATVPVPAAPGSATLPAFPTATSAVPAVPVVPMAPPAPASRTSLADQIQVTGVIQTRGRLSAIIQSPQDGSGRYVVAGDYLANGRVLVKRIESRPGSEPIVVLEQNGIQVVKSVGSPLASAR